MFRNNLLILGVVLSNILGVLVGISSLYDPEFSFSSTSCSISQASFNALDCTYSETRSANPKASRMNRTAVDAAID